jgi:hypothetical protein
MRKQDFILFIVSIVTLWSCQKQTPLPSTEDKLADKVWFLEKKIVGQQAYAYERVSTFSFRLTKDNKKYIDSDGIDGSYTITLQPSSIILRISSSTRQIDFYEITLLEKEHLIMEYTKNNVLNTLYFSTRP